MSTDPTPDPTDAAIRAALRDAAADPAPDPAPAAQPGPAPDPLANRRPLASRKSGWAADATAALVARGIAPNTISMASVGFAALGVLLFWAGATPGLLGGIALILAAIACQLRLICNLLDGMVAVEGGRGTPDGPYWNEVPDRIADLLLFAGAGLAAGQPALGLLIGAGAILTAYLREFGRAEGFAPDFSGPMAKPHRMAALTGLAILAAVAPLFWTREAVLIWGLALILAGVIATLLRRSWRLLTALRSRAGHGNG